MSWCGRILTGGFLSTVMFYLQIYHSGIPVATFWASALPTHYEYATRVLIVTFLYGHGRQIAPPGLASTLDKLSLAIHWIVTLSTRRGEATKSTFDIYDISLGTFDLVSFVYTWFRWFRSGWNKIIFGLKKTPTKYVSCEWWAPYESYVRVCD